MSLPRFLPGDGSGNVAPAVTDIIGEVFDLFVPGLVVARTLGTWRNARPSGRALGLALEANLLTAPTAGDASNYWEIRAVDAVGATMLLPISSNGVTHYSLNSGTAVVIARPKLNAGFPSGDATILAEGIKFKPTQNLAVAGLIASFAISNFNDTTNFGTRQVRASLLDATGAVLAAASANTTGPVITDVQALFGTPVGLVSGRTYYAVFDIIQSYSAIAGTAGNAASGTDPGMATPAAYTAQPAPITMVGLGGCSLTNGDGTTPRAAVLGETVTDAIRANLAPHQSWVDGTATPLAAIGLLGLAETATFQGDVTLSYVAIGAPAAGAAGSDVNMRLVLGAAA